MKKIFLALSLFVLINASSQVSDSMEIESLRSDVLRFNNDVAVNVLPDFTAKDLAGNTYTNNNVRNGKVTFINLWFISCLPCIAEIPNLNRLYDMMKSRTDFQFFAITYESETDVREAIKKYDIRFPVLLISGKEAMKLTFGSGFPANIVLDKEGKMRFLLSGGSLNPDSSGFELYWKQEIEKLLKGDRPVSVSKPVNSSGNKSGIVFIDSLLKIQSLDALLNYFKGQSIFIDLWASWCVPCRQDFVSKNSLDSFLSKHEIVRVFLSIDNSLAEQIWKSVIYEYNLNGYHLLAGAELFKDLKQKIYKNEAINIPRYIIVRNGKIVELNAFRPSDDQKLIKQLTEELF